MAFEKIYEFIDAIEKQMRLIDDKKEAIQRLDRLEWEAARTDRLVLNSQWEIYFDSLRIYLETTLKTAKFKSQRHHCIEVMTKLNPSFMKAYLMTPAQLKRVTKKQTSKTKK